MRHIMVDLETWGITPGSDIRSIGAVEFNLQTGRFGDEFYVNVDGGGGYCLTKDESTKKWWSEQSAEAQARLDEDVLHIADGLTAFAAWWNEHDGGDGVTYTRLWAHGPHFDEQILNAAFRAVGLPVPWNYRAPRDLRTCLEDAGMDPKNDIPDYGVAHNALDDAKAQALAVIEAKRRLVDLKYDSLVLGRTA